MEGHKLFARTSLSYVLLCLSAPSRLMQNCGGIAQNMDAMLHYFRGYMATFPPNSIRATTTDCFFNARVWAIYQTQKNNLDSLRYNERTKMTDYLKGLYLQHSTSWAIIDYVFMPLFMEAKSHWILVVLDKRNWTLDIYNSLRRTVRDKVVVDSVAHIRSAIPLLANKVDVLPEPIPVTPMDCRIINGVPQQQNGGDCGIFVIEYAEYIFKNKLHQMANPFDTLIA